MEITRPEYSFRLWYARTSKERSPIVCGYEGGAGAGRSDAKVYRNVGLSEETKKPRDPVGGPSYFYLFFFVCSSAFPVPQSQSYVIGGVRRDWCHPRVDIIERHGTPRMLRFNYLIRNRERVTSNEFDRVLAVRLRG